MEAAAASLWVSPEEEEDKWTLGASLTERETEKRKGKWKKRRGHDGGNIPSTIESHEEKARNTGRRGNREGERGRLEVITGEKEGVRDKHAAWY